MGAKGPSTKMLGSTLNIAATSPHSTTSPVRTERIVSIGKGLYLGHPYNITVASEAELGNNVYVGINAVVVGNIKIGNDVLIAPNSYVNFDVPDHSIVIGNPAAVHIKEGATKDYVNFLV